MKRLDIPHGPSDPELDGFVKRAAEAFAAPIALLTLIRDDMLWAKASFGFDLDTVPRGDSLCTHAIDRAEPLEICDALADERFRTLPPVQTEPHVRYYIGAPLTIMSGTDVGALCVIDTQPRPPASQDERAYLISLARQATRALERQARIKDGLVA